MRSFEGGHSTQTHACHGGPHRGPPSGVFVGVVGMFGLRAAVWLQDTAVQKRTTCAVLSSCTLLRGQVVAKASDSSVACAQPKS